jgi:hypothetical protein
MKPFPVVTCVTWHCHARHSVMDNFQKVSELVSAVDQPYRLILDFQTHLSTAAVTVTQLSELQPLRSITSGTGMHGMPTGQDRTDWLTRNWELVMDRPGTATNASACKQQVHGTGMYGTCMR